MALSSPGPPRPMARRAVWLWLVFLAAAAAITARSHYIADLSAFLPSAPTPEQAVLLDQVRSGVAARVLLLGIEGGDAPARAEASRHLAAALRTSGQFESVHNGDQAGWDTVGRFLFEHRYLLSPAVDAQRFTATGLRDAIDETVALLGTPAGALVRPVILRDPTGEAVRLAEAMLPAQGPRSEGGVWVSRQAPRAVLVATTRAAGGDLDAQEQAQGLVRAAFAAQAAPALRLRVSGAPLFAVESRAQIQAEVERLAIAGSLAIVALLLVAFGSLRSLAIATLPVATGVLAGIAAISVGFGHVHGVTLGFGTTLIGEAVDYAIYYLIQARAGADPAGDAVAGADSGARHWLRASWPTVRLGLLTSVCGFGALVFSGFPGLAQLGVFSIAGLVAAALSTRYVLPVFAPRGAPGGGMRGTLGRFAGLLARHLPRLRLPLQLVALGACATLALLVSPWRGDLASLSPVGSAQLQLDADLRNDVGAPDAGTLVALAAADEAGALEAAEAAGRRLDVLVARGVLQGYDSPARLLPSPATQAARRAALPDPASLATRLADATADGPLAAARLGAFVADVQSARSQAIVGRAGLDGTPLAQALDSLLVPGVNGRPWRVFLSLQTGAASLDTSALQAALADLPGARIVRIRAELDALYARYLREALWQALLGAAGVCALLAWHLRSVRRLAQVVQPIAASAVIVLAGFAASGAALGILHLVGLLLVVAIGSNYALFFDHLRHAERFDTDTLASLALANLTTVVSFALLASSSIPVLSAIGGIVAPGALLCLLLSAAFVARTPASGQHGKIPPLHA